MNYFKRLLVLSIACLSGISFSYLPAQAIASPPTAALPAGLSFAEIKMTGDEFVVITNNTTATIPDLSNYWLDDFNSTSPLATGTSSSSQQLPASSLGPGQDLLLSSVPMATCDAAVAGKLAVSLTDAGGFLQLAQVGQDATGAVIQTAGDVVSWSSGASGLIQSVPSSTKDPRGAYYRYLSGSSYAWQPADLDTSNSCQLNVVVAGGSTSQTVAVTPLAMAASSPPATILGVGGGAVSDGASTNSLPVTDIGLTAPQLNELLPNPSGTGNDATDEFIELYNPNSVSFDLSGFTIQTGTTAIHSYIFPSGTLLAANSFHAFYSLVTGVSLSNSGGQAKLLDPYGTIISSSAIYSTAKDGQAWALANGSWVWTTDVTPNAANIIVTPLATTKRSAISTTAKAKTASKTTSSKAKTSGATKATTVAASNASDTLPSTPIHPWVLALVALAALLYGTYEYRADLANRIHHGRQYLAARWQSRR